MSPAEPAASPTAAGQAAIRQVAIHFKITAAGTSSTARKPQFVSPAINGLLVQVYTSPQASNPTPIGTTATDVSPGSFACGGATGTRTCTIFIPVPAGTEDFVFTSYDQPPTTNTTNFPPGSNILSVGELTQTITLGTTNVLSVSLGGVIASLSVAPLTQSALPGSASSYPLAISALDSDGNTIIAGSSDPYNNPITVTATESGGTGFTSVTLGGSSGTGSSSVTLAQSTQIATVLYTGGGAAGYGAQLAVSSQGVPTVTVAFNPFFVSSTSPLYTASTATVGFTQSSQTVTMNLAEVGYTGTFSATAGASCSGVATVSAPAAGANSTAIITEGTNSGSCTITFSDGTVNFPVTVSAQFASSQITIPGINGTFTSFPSGSNPSYIASGSDGALWYTITGAIGRITTAGSITQYALPGGGTGYGIASGSDGALWFTVLGNPGSIGRITTSGAITEYSIPTSNSGPEDITSGPDGALWFTEGQANQIGRIALNGTVTEYAVPTSSSALGDIASGPDGALWFAEGVGKIGRITTGGAITEFSVPTANSSPYAIVAGHDGALWFTENGTGKIGRITVGGSVTEFQSPSSNGLVGLTTGPDGALWFTEDQRNAIGRITAAGAISEDVISTPNSFPAYGITTGPDGAIWFVDYANQVVRLQ